jgi:putative Holliday junction resolvase
MALDVGERRIGVALSDAGRMTANPWLVLHRKNRDADIAALARVAREQEVVELVIGLPLNSEDRIGSSAEKVIRLGRRLERVLGLPVTYVDEWESTVEAQEALLAADTSRAKRREVVDKLAATVILRRFLDGLGLVELE